MTRKVFNKPERVGKKREEEMGEKARPDYERPDFDGSPNKNRNSTKET